MAKRVCGYAAKVTRKDATGRVTEVSYVTCTLPDDGIHERHEVRDKRGVLVAHFLRGVDFELREQP